MSCLMEIILEVFLEGILEIIWAIFPKSKKEMNPKQEEWFEAGIKIIAGILIMVMVVGIFLQIGGETPTQISVGRYLTYIPLGIVVVNIILSIIIKIVRHKKGK